jgi:hypothetical protein
MCLFVRVHACYSLCTKIIIKVIKYPNHLISTFKLKVAINK